MCVQFDLHIVNWFLKISSTPLRIFGRIECGLFENEKVEKGPFKSFKWHLHSTCCCFDNDPYCMFVSMSVRPSIPTDSIQLQLTTLNYVYVTDKKGKDQTTNGCDAAAEQQHQWIW